MPILGDALDEAGCTSEDILNHCRGRMCRTCDGLGKLYTFDPYKMESEEHDCGRCKGTGRLEIKGGPHVRGCWVLDLILGKH
jgi:DnaJ-class molecular chaperone